MRACDAVLGARGEAKGASPTHDRASPLGHFVDVYGEYCASRIHYDQAIALYDPAEHRPLATRFSQDVGVTILSLRPLALWLLGYPDAACRDTEHALKNAGDIGHAGTLMFALTNATLTHIHCRDFVAANAAADELTVLAGEKGALYWKGYGMMLQGCLLALAGKTSNAVQVITSGIITCRSTGSTAMMPWYISNLARAYAEIDHYAEARSCIDEAVTASDRAKEKWCDAEIHRTGGEIALIHPSRTRRRRKRVSIVRATASAASQVLGTAR